MQDLDYRYVYIYKIYKWRLGLKRGDIAGACKAATKMGAPVLDSGFWITRIRRSPWDPMGFCCFLQHLLFNATCFFFESLVSGWWLSHFVSSRYRCSHWFSFGEGFVTYIICDDVLKRHTIQIYRLFPRCLYESHEIIHQKKNHPKRKHKTIGGVLKYVLFSHLFGEDSDSTTNSKNGAVQGILYYTGREKNFRWSSWRTSHYGLDGTGAGTRYHHHQCSGGAQCLA